MPRTAKCQYCKNEMENASRYQKYHGSPQRKGSCSWYVDQERIKKRYSEYAEIVKERNRLGISNDIESVKGSGYF